jgi:hypothetical protein
MARGWESKSVESQIEDRGFERTLRREAPSTEEVERTRKREGLEMSRRRIVNELANARSAVHRTALENALAHLESELARLG